jgi:hypothetical protein
MTKKHSSWPQGHPKHPHHSALKVPPAKENDADNLNRTEHIMHSTAGRSMTAEEGKSAIGLKPAEQKEFTRTANWVDRVMKALNGP